MAKWARERFCEKCWHLASRPVIPTVPDTIEDYSGRMGKLPESLISSNHHSNEFLYIIHPTAISTAELAKSSLSLLIFVRQKHFLKGGTYLVIKNSIKSTLRPLCTWKACLLCKKELETYLGSKLRNQYNCLRTSTHFANNVVLCYYFYVRSVIL